MAQLEWHMEDLAKAFSRKYKVKQWLSVHAVFPVAWNEWISLDPMIQRAIMYETDEVIREREKASRKHEMDLKMEMARSSSTHQFKDLRSTSIGNLMSK